MTCEFRYAPAAVVAGYARSALGLSITLGPLVFLQPAFWMIAVFTAGAALFLFYTARVVARHLASFVLGDSGIEERGLFGVRIPWDELRAVQLNYYSTRNDRSNGWIELVVRGAQGTIRIESVIDGFPEIAGRVAREALRCDCPLDERTRVHFASIGVDVGAPPISQPLHGIGHA